MTRSTADGGGTRLPLHRSIGFERRRGKITLGKVEKMML
jgi:hypothetical protein